MKTPSATTSRKSVFAYFGAAQRAEETALFQVAMRKEKRTSGSAIQVNDATPHPVRTRFPVLNAPVPGPIFTTAHGRYLACRIPFQEPS